MTEDLWYHSLKFLDKYRTDVRNYDIEELYQFTDKTGILERHKHMLIKPFKEHQVDMKIMYYELIKMLIDYERKNQPDTFDSTKTVGKIEGYQELTNKLQRYLNQRFIVDIDQLNKTHTSINQAFGGDVTKINFMQKFEALEEKVGNLERKNESLKEQINVLKERDKEVVNSFVFLNNQQSIFEQKQIEFFNITEKDIVPKITSLDKRMQEFFGQSSEMEEKISKNEVDISGIKKSLEETENHFKVHLEENIKPTLNAIILEQGESKANLQDQISKVYLNTENVASLQTQLKEIEEQTGNNLNENLLQVKTSTHEQITELEKIIENNKLNISKNDEGIKQNRNNIVDISSITQSLEEQIHSFKSTSEASWKIAEDAVEKQNMIISDIQDLVDVSKDRIDGFEREIPTKFQNMQEIIDILQKDNEKSNQLTKENNFHLTKVNSVVEGLETEFESAKDRLRKVVDDIQNVNKSVQVFESRHVETVERMKEVTMLVTTIESSVQSQDQRFEKQKEEDYNLLNSQLHEVKKNQNDQGKSIEDISNDNQMLLEKINMLNKNNDARFKGIDSASQGALELLQNATKNNGDQFSQINTNIQANSEKTKELEDAFHIQLEKALYMETLTEKINMIEENRQQSDARVKDEIDSTIHNDQISRENDKQEFLQKVMTLDDSLQKSVQSADTKSDLFKIELDQLTRKLKAYEETVVKLNEDSSDNSKSIIKLSQNVNGNIEDLKNMNLKITEKTDNLLLKSDDNSVKLLKMEKENHIQNVASLEEFARKETENNSRIKEDMENIIENNINILSDFKSDVQKQIHDLTLNHNNSLLTQRNEINQSIQTFESNIQTMNNTFVNMKQETFAMTSRLDSDFEGAFNQYKGEVEENLTSLKQTLSDQINKKLSQNQEQVKEAENHVINLRNLNGKLMEQVKENLTAHGEEQQTIINELQNKNQDFLEKLQKELDREIENLIQKTDTNMIGLETSNKAVDILSQKFADLDGDIKWKTERDNVIENIQAHDDIIVKNKVVLESISKNISDLDIRHKETVERMKEIAQLVEKYEKNMKDAGQNFREDQRKELKGIEKQLNTIYLEYEKMEKDMEGVKKENETQIMLNKTFETNILDVNNELTGKEKELLANIKDQADNITNTDNKIVKLMEQANTFMVNDVTKMEKLGSIEVLLKDLKDKQGELESADLFLQESCRQATEKSATLERKTQQSEEELHKLYSQQKEEIENKLKVQISVLLKDFEQLTNSKDQITESIEKQNEEFDGKLNSIEKCLDKLNLSENERIKESQEINDRIISLQFQAEKASYVETLASQVNKMDASHQKSEAESKEEINRLSSDNSQKLKDILTKYEQIKALFEEEKETATTKYNNLYKQLNTVTELTNVNETSFNNLKPITKNLEVKVENLESKIGSEIAMIISKTEEHKELIERSTSSISVFSEKILAYENDQSDLTEVLQKKTEEDITNLREQLGSHVTGIKTQLDAQGNKLSTLEAKLEGTSGQTDRMLEDLVQHNSDIITVKEALNHETGLIVKRISQQQSEVTSLEKRFEDLESAQIYENKQFELTKVRMDGYLDSLDKIDERMTEIEESDKQQNSLILAVEKTLNDKFEELDTEMREGTTHSQKEMSKIRTEICNNKDNFWTLIIEIYSAFRGSTVVLKSEGVVKSEQADVLGVYRMIDSYNDRPVYKQEGSENYIYYSATSSSWLVGTVIGQQYGWLRNQSDSAAKSRWLPDLSSGWEYRPLIRDTGSVELAGSPDSSWKSDDGTLRIESLRDIEKVNEVIRDIRNSREVD